MALSVAGLGSSQSALAVIDDEFNDLCGLATKFWTNPFILQMLKVGNPNGFNEVCAIHIPQIDEFSKLGTYVRKILPCIVVQIRGMVFGDRIRSVVVDVDFTTKLKH